MIKEISLNLITVSLLLVASILSAQESELTHIESLEERVIALYQQGKYQEGIPIAREVLKLWEKVLGTDHPRIATSLNNLAELYRAQSDYSTAEPLYQRALKIYEQALEPNHPNVALSLNNLAELYRVQGGYSTAEPLYQRALKIREQALGPNHPDVATSLNSLALLYQAQGNYAAAEPLYQRALKIGEQALGPNHPNVAASLNNLAGLYQDQGNYAAAEPLYQRAIKIFEQALGPNHPNVAMNLNNLSLLYQAQGNYTVAEPLSQRALKILEQALGPNHPDVATSLSGLAALYQAQGNYTAAEPLAQRTLKIREQALGPDHPDVAISLIILAALYQVRGNYTAAEPLYQRALRIREQALGPEHPDIATSLNNLAVLYRAQGNYTAAEPLYQRALRIREQALGPKHPDIATSLNNLAALYQVQGNYTAAEPFYQRALKINEQALGPDHPHIALGLNNLAALYQVQVSYTAAEPLYQRAIKISEQALGSNHPNVAISLTNLAELYRLQGNYIAAESSLQHALKILEKTLGPNHPNVALGLNNLAGLYHIQGNYAAADPFYQRALKISEKVLGPSHPNVVMSLNNLAVMEMARNRPQIAIQNFQKAAKIETAFMQNILMHSTEAEKLAFLRAGEGNMYALISLVYQVPSTDFVTKRTAFETMLQRKAASLEASSQQQQAYGISSNSVSTRLHDRLRSLSQQIARLTFAGPRDTALTVYRHQLDKLSAEREQAEDSLAQRSGAFLRERQVRHADVEQVAAALPKGSRLIDFVRYQEFDFKAKGQERQWGATRYAAFSLAAKKTESLQMIDLGLAQPIDSLVFAYRQEIKNVLNLGSRQRQAAEQRLAIIMQLLYRLLFAPIKTTLPDSGMLYCAPDGPLHLLPFEILKDEAGKYLVERYQFNYLGSGRDLLRFTKASPSEEMYVFADANFDGKPLVQIASNESLTPLNVQRSRDWRGGKFTPLDGTVAEGHAIQALFKLNEHQMFLDIKASEENLLALKSPWRLHIATHGFFMKDQEDIKQLMGQELFMSTGSERRLSLGQFENPLLRSGLALAGANTIGQKQDSTQTYDGIATAYEISGMNLQGTDLVVLSACETGLGEVQNGEGVFGLRRAFQLAGAQTVVMSLWKVPDNETKELMIDFYTRLKNGEGKSQALRNAQLGMMKKQREKYGSAHPYFWGAFICAGNPE